MADDEAPFRRITLTHESIVHSSIYCHKRAPRTSAEDITMSKSKTMALGSSCSHEGERGANKQAIQLDRCYAKGQKLTQGRRSHVFNLSFIFQWVEAAKSRGHDSIQQRSEEVQGDSGKMSAGKECSRQSKNSPKATAAQQHSRGEGSGVKRDGV